GAGAAQWWITALVAAALIAWEQWYPRIWLWAHAARPLTRPELIPRFDAIVQRAGTVVPAVYSVGPQGSRFVNAVALPSVRHPAVAMGDALLDLLDPDENAAIFAHELAHFDHLNPRWIRRSQLVNRLLILAGVALPVITTFVAPTLAPWIGWIWPIGVLVALAHRAARSQQHETESDLRAAALCGDPEVLVRALAKVHFHARIPRRWAVDVERLASHPSLVRRIQAIRAGGTAAAEQLGAATIVRSPRDGTWVVFDDDRAYWLDGVAPDTHPELAALRDAASSYRAVNYRDLAELRIAAAGNERTLHARTRAGDAWTVPLAVDDVARVQHTLDIVDIRLGRPAAAATPASMKVLGLVAGIVAMLAGQLWIILVPAALALWKPGPATLAALGSMSLVRAAIATIEQDYWLSAEVFGLSTAALALVGVISIVTVIRHGREGAPVSDLRLTVGVLGAVASVVAIATVGAASVDGMPGGFASGGVPLLDTLGTALFGIAAALLTARTPRTRTTAHATLAAAAIVAMLGIDRSALSLQGALAEATARATPDAESEVGGTASGLRVSPNGERFLATNVPTGRRTPTLTLFVGRVGGPVREVSAIAADFLDDQRVLALDVIDQGMEIRIERADTVAPPVWADTLAGFDLEEPRLSIDRDASMWSIIGAAADTDATLLVTGRVGEKGSARPIAIPDTIPVLGDPLIFGTANAIVAPVFPGMMRGRTAYTSPLAMFTAMSLRAELWRVAGGEVRPIARLSGVPQCGAPMGGLAACVVRGRSSMGLYTVTADGVATELARLRGSELGVMAVGPGPRASSMQFDGSLLVADLAARRLTRITLPQGSDYPSEVRTGDGYVVTLSYPENRRSVVRRYRVQ
ncbi:MAG TPA: M48 family metalloprotease, partial [Gemmatimonadaceae bacterium]|nr:M48 family metalloprotease [Gemmatimonadaceae bacterium]